MKAKLRSYYLIRSANFSISNLFLKPNYAQQKISKAKQERSYLSDYDCIYEFKYIAILRLLARAKVNSYLIHLYRKLCFVMGATQTVLKHF
jgi:hypothetical protein